MGEPLPEPMLDVAITAGEEFGRTSEMTQKPAISQSTFEKPLFVAPRLNGFEKREKRQENHSEEQILFRHGDLVLWVFVCLFGFFFKLKILSVNISSAHS